MGFELSFLIDLVPVIFQTSSSSSEQRCLWPSSSSPPCLCVCTTAGRPEQDKAARRAPPSLSHKAHGIGAADFCRVYVALWARTVKRTEWMETKRSVHGGTWAQRKSFIWLFSRLTFWFQPQPLSRWNAMNGTTNPKAFKFLFLTLWHRLHMSCFRRNVLHSRRNQAIWAKTDE